LFSWIYRHITFKFVVFIRYCLFFELFLNLVLTILVAVTYNTKPTHLDEWWGALFGGQVFRNPSSTNIGNSLLMLCETWMLLLNTRYILGYLIEWKMSMKFIKGMKCRLYYFVFGRDSLHGDIYLLPHIGIYLRGWIQYKYPNSEFARTSAAVVSATVFFMLWNRCFTYGSGLYESFGLTIATIKKMAVDTRHYFLVLLLFIFGFSSIMTTMYANSDTMEFNSLGSSIVTLFFFVFNLDLNAVIDDKIPLRKYCAFFFLGLYMVVVGMTLVNLIIAVMTNSYEDIKQKAKEQHILTRSRFVVRFEETIGLLMLFKEYYGRSSGNTMAWYKWEKENFSGRKVIVKEYPGGKVSIDSKKSWLQFFLTERTPPWFMRLVYFYENTSCVLAPMPFADGFSWLKLGLKPGKKTKPEDIGKKFNEKMGLLWTQKQENSTGYKTLDPFQKDDYALHSEEANVHIGYCLVSERYQEAKTTENSMEHTKRMMFEKLDKLIEMQQDLTKRVNSIESAVHCRTKQN